MSPSMFSEDFNAMCEPTEQHVCLCLQSPVLDLSLQPVTNFNKTVNKKLEISIDRDVEERKFLSLKQPSSSYNSSVLLPDNHNNTLDRESPVKFVSDGSKAAVCLKVPSQSVLSDNEIGVTSKVEFNRAVASIANMQLNHLSPKFTLYTHHIKHHISTSNNHFQMFSCDALTQCMSLFETNNNPASSNLVPCDSPTSSIQSSGDKIFATPQCYNSSHNFDFCAPPQKKLSDPSLSLACDKNNYEHSEKHYKLSILPSSIHNTTEAISLQQSHKSPSYQPNTNKSSCIKNNQELPPTNSYNFPNSEPTPILYDGNIDVSIESSDCAVSNKSLLSDIEDTNFLKHSISNTAKQYEFFHFQTLSNQPLSVKCGNANDVYDKKQSGNSLSVSEEFSGQLPKSCSELKGASSDACEQIDNRPITNALTTALLTNKLKNKHLDTKSLQSINKTTNKQCPTENTKHAESYYLSTKESLFTPRLVSCDIYTLTSSKSAVENNKDNKLSKWTNGILTNKCANLGYVEAIDSEHKSANKSQNTPYSATESPSKPKGNSCKSYTLMVSESGREMVSKQEFSPNLEHAQAAYVEPVKSKFLSTRELTTKSKEDFGRSYTLTLSKSGSGNDYKAKKVSKAIETFPSDENVKATEIKLDESKNQTATARELPPKPKKDCQSYSLSVSKSVSENDYKTKMVSKPVDTISSSEHVKAAYFKPVQSKFQSAKELPSKPEENCCRSYTVSVSKSDLENSYKAKKVSKPVDTVSRNERSKATYFKPVETKFQCAKELPSKPKEDCCRSYTLTLSKSADESDYKAIKDSKPMETVSGNQCATAAYFKPVQSKFRFAQELPSTPLEHSCASCTLAVSKSNSDNNYEATKVSKSMKTVLCNEHAKAAYINPSESKFQSSKEMRSKPKEDCCRSYTLTLSKSANENDHKAIKDSKPMETVSSNDCAKVAYFKPIQSKFRFAQELPSKPKEDSCASCTLAVSKSDNHSDCKTKSVLKPMDTLSYNEHAKAACIEPSESKYQSAKELPSKPKEDCCRSYTLTVLKSADENDYKAIKDSKPMATVSSNECAKAAYFKPIQSKFQVAKELSSRPQEDNCSSCTLTVSKSDNENDYKAKKVSKPIETVSSSEHAKATYLKPCEPELQSAKEVTSKSKEDSCSSYTLTVSKSGNDNDYKAKKVSKSMETVSSNQGARAAYIKPVESENQTAIARELPPKCKEYSSRSYTLTISKSDVENDYKAKKGSEATGNVPNKERFWATYVNPVQSKIQSVIARELPSKPNKDSCKSSSLNVSKSDNTHDCKGKRVSKPLETDPSNQHAKESCDKLFESKFHSTRDAIPKCKADSDSLYSLYGSKPGSRNENRGIFSKLKETILRIQHDKTTYVEPVTSTFQSERESPSKPKEHSCVESVSTTFQCGRKSPSKHREDSWESYAPTVSKSSSENDCKVNKISKPLETVPINEHVKKTCVNPVESKFQSAKELPPKSKEDFCKSYTLTVSNSDKENHYKAKKISKSNETVSSNECAKTACFKPVESKFQCAKELPPKPNEDSCKSYALTVSNSADENDYKGKKLLKPEETVPKKHPVKKTCVDPVESKFQSAKELPPKSKEDFCKSSTLTVSNSDKENHYKAKTISKSNETVSSNECAKTAYFKPVDSKFQSAMEVPPKPREDFCRSYTLTVSNSADENDYKGKKLLKPVETVPKKQPVKKTCVNPVESKFQSAKELPPKSREDFCKSYTLTVSNSDKENYYKGKKVSKSNETVSSNECAKTAYFKPVESKFQSAMEVPPKPKEDFCRSYTLTVSNSADENDYKGKKLLKPVETVPKKHPVKKTCVNPVESKFQSAKELPPKSREDFCKSYTLTVSNSDKENHYKAKKISKSNETVSSNECAKTAYFKPVESKFQSAMEVPPKPKEDSCKSYTLTVSNSADENDYKGKKLLKPEETVPKKQPVKKTCVNPVESKFQSAKELPPKSKEDFCKSYTLTVSNSDKENHYKAKKISKSNETVSSNECAKTPYFKDVESTLQSAQKLPSKPSEDSCKSYTLTVSNSSSDNDYKAKKVSKPMETVSSTECAKEAYFKPSESKLQTAKELLSKPKEDTCRSYTLTVAKSADENNYKGKKVSRSTEFVPNNELSKAGNCESVGSKFQSARKLPPNSKEDFSGTKTLTVSKSGYGNDNKEKKVLKPIGSVPSNECADIKPFKSKFQSEKKSLSKLQEDSCESYSLTVSKAKSENDNREEKLSKSTEIVPSKEHAYATYVESVKSYFQSTKESLPKANKDSCSSFALTISKPCRENDNIGKKVSKPAKNISGNECYKAANVEPVPPEPKEDSCASYTLTVSKSCSENDYKGKTVSKPIKPVPSNAHAKAVNAESFKSKFSPEKEDCTRKKVIMETVPNFEHGKAVCVEPIQPKFHFVSESPPKPNKNSCGSYALIVSKSSDENGKKGNKVLKPKTTFPSNECAKADDVGPFESKFESMKESSSKPKEDSCALYTLTVSKSGGENDYKGKKVSIPIETVRGKERALTANVESDKLKIQSPEKEEIKPKKVLIDTVPSYEHGKAVCVEPIQPKFHSASESPPQPKENSCGSYALTVSNSSDENGKKENKVSKPKTTFPSNECAKVDDVGPFESKFRSMKESSFKPKEDSCELYTLTVSKPGGENNHKAKKDSKPLETVSGKDLALTADVKSNKLEIQSPEKEENNKKKVLIDTVPRYEHGKAVCVEPIQPKFHFASESPPKPKEDSCGSYALTVSNSGKENGKKENKVSKPKTTFPSNECAKADDVGPFESKFESMKESSSKPKEDSCALYTLTVSKPGGENNYKIKKVPKPLKTVSSKEHALTANVESDKLKIQSQEKEDNKRKKAVKDTVPRCEHGKAVCVEPIKPKFHFATESPPKAKEDSCGSYALTVSNSDNENNNKENEAAESRTTFPSKECAKVTHVEPAESKFRSIKELSPKPKEDSCGSYSLTVSKLGNENDDKEKNVLKPTGTVSSNELAKAACVESIGSIFQSTKKSEAVPCKKSAEATYGESAMSKYTSVKKVPPKPKEDFCGSNDLTVSKSGNKNDCKAMKVSKPLEMIEKPIEIPSNDHAKVAFVDSTQSKPKLSQSPPKPKADFCDSYSQTVSQSDIKNVNEEKNVSKAIENVPSYECAEAADVELIKVREHICGSYTLTVSKSGYEIHECKRKKVPKPIETNPGGEDAKAAYVEHVKPKFHSAKESPILPKEHTCGSYTLTVSKAPNINDDIGKKVSKPIETVPSNECANAAYVEPFKSKFQFAKKSLSQLKEHTCGSYTLTVSKAKIENYNKGKKVSKSMETVQNNKCLNATDVEPIESKFQSSKETPSKLKGHTCESYALTVSKLASKNGHKGKQVSKSIEAVTNNEYAKATCVKPVDSKLQSTMESSPQPKEHTCGSYTLTVSKAKGENDKAMKLSKPIESVPSSECSNATYVKPVWSKLQSAKESQPKLKEHTCGSYTLTVSKLAHENKLKNFHSIDNIRANCKPAESRSQSAMKSPPKLKEHTCGSYTLNVMKSGFKNDYEEKKFSKPMETVPCNENTKMNSVASKFKFAKELPPKVKEECCESSTLTTSNLISGKDGTRGKLSQSIENAPRNEHAKAACAEPNGLKYLSTKNLQPKLKDRTCESYTLTVSKRDGEGYFKGKNIFKQIDNIPRCNNTKVGSIESKNVGFAFPINYNGVRLQSYVNKHDESKSSDGIAEKLPESKFFEKEKPVLKSLNRNFDPENVLNLSLNTFEIEPCCQLFQETTRLPCVKTFPNATKVYSKGMSNVGISKDIFKYQLENQLHSNISEQNQANLVLKSEQVLTSSFYSVLPSGQSITPLINYFQKLGANESQSINVSSLTLYNVYYSQLPLFTKHWKTSYRTQTRSNMP